MTDPRTPTINLGCLGTVIWCLLFWALLFGVTWHGRHYGITCSCDKGVEVAP